MKSWSIPAGRLLGADVRIHLTFFFLLLFVWMTEAVSRGTMSVGRPLALVGIILGSVVAHELGHALVARRCGAQVRSMVLLPIGGLSFLDDSAFGAKAHAGREIRIAVAGPWVNAILGLAAALLILSLEPQVRLEARPWVHSGNLLRSVVWVNVFLATLNVLPAFPLDGGRILRALLARKMDRVRATRLAVTVGQGFAMIFIFAGIWYPWLMMIGLFLFVGAQLEERSIEFQAVLENIRMEDVMLTEFSTLSPADTLEHALSKAVHTLQDDFPVVRGNDMVGVISRQGILEALRLDGNAYVQTVMNRAFEVATKGESLASAFRKITSRGLNIIPVVEGEHLVGIVTLQNLMHSMGMLAESRKLKKKAVSSQ